jgi:hypothetical protein
MNHGGAHSSVSDPVTPITATLPIRMTSALDDHAIVAEILADRARALSRDPAQEVLMLVAHGPNDEAENAQWLENMRHLAARMPQAAAFARIEVSTVRDDADDSVRAHATQELRGMVERAHSEQRRALIVPLLLSYGGIESGIRTRLEGLDYVMADRALLPDPRIARWIIESACPSCRAASTMP